MKIEKMSLMSVEGDVVARGTGVVRPIAGTKDRWGGSIDVYQANLTALNDIIDGKEDGIVYLCDDEVVLSEVKVGEFSFNSESYSPNIFFSCKGPWPGQ